MSQAHDLALSRLEKVGPGTVKKWLAVFPTSEALWNAAKQSVSLESSPRWQLLHQYCQKVDPVQLEHECLQKGLNFIGISSPLYPQLLKEIPDPPLVLFYKGRLELLASKINLAVVGTRNPSSYGIQATQNIIQALKNYSVCIVSGMAQGIDRVAHQAAMAHQLPTVAVLGYGLDYLFPPGNQEIFKNLQKHGLVLTEYWPDQKYQHWTFPRRNRIISGLSQACLIVEGAKQSGALITAKHALEQNRNVLAVPGSYASRFSEGPHDLIKNGAKLVHDIQDILEELGEHSPVRLPSQAQTQTIKTSSVISISYPDRYQKIAELIGQKDGIHFEELVLLSKFQVQELSQRLTEMELEGWIKVLPGRRYAQA